MDVQYLVTVNAEGATKAVQVFDGTIKGLGKESEIAGKAHEGMWKQVALGEIAYKAAEKAGRFLWEFLKDSATAAMDAEKANKSLDAALEITGRNLPGLSKHFKDYADTLMSQTTYDDEAIKGAQALLVQLTNLDKNGIDRATKGAIGLASVFGMDLESASQLVAKSMNGNAGLLGRYGIKIDETATKEQQRAQILEKLEQFYGRATAETETYSGKVAQLKVKYGEVQEAVGSYIIKNTTLLTTLNNLANETIFYLTLKDKLIDQQNQENKTAKELWKNLWEASYAIGLNSKVLKDLNEKYDGNINLILREIRTNKDLVPLQEKLHGNRQKELDIQKKLVEEQKKIEKGTNTFIDSTKKADKELVKQIDLFKDMPGAIKKYHSELDTIPPALDKIGTATMKIDANFNRFTINTSGSLKKLLDDISEFTSQYGEYFTTAFNTFDAIVNQSYTNRQAQAENDYQIALANLKKKGLSEADYQKEVDKLDAEYDSKRKKIAHDAASYQKKVAIANAIVNGFEAVSKAYTSLPFPWNIGVAFAQGLLSAALVSKIAAQPIPLAKGAIFKQPTLMSGANGRDYQVGDVPGGESEVVASGKAIREAIFGKGGNNRITVIKNYVILDGKLMKTFINKTITNDSQTGRLNLSAGAIA